MSQIDFKIKIRSDRTNEHSAHQDLLIAYESDRGRIINSAAIRRLQQKTQVFPLERNSAVRSRLTHSLEVQQNGRFITQQIFKRLRKSNQLAEYGLTDLERAIESMVEMACLMHDIGNPPFGHFGEHAMAQWFARHIDEILPPHQLTSSTDNETEAAYKALHQQIRQDLMNFEGNAQAIRLIYSLLRFNLTYAQVAGVLKYTRPAYQGKSDIPADKSYLMKKVGYYLSEEPYINELCQVLEIKPGNRHPLSYIMEAADDISYCLADIEDAVEKNILSVDTLCQLLQAAHQQLTDDHDSHERIHRDMSFKQLIDDALAQSRQEPINKIHVFFVVLRVNLIHPLVKHAANRFVENIEAIYHGHFNHALLEDDGKFHAVTKTFKRVAREHVFNHKEVETAELQGYRIIGGLLDIYQALLHLDTDTFLDMVAGKGSKYHPIEQRLFNKLGKKHLSAYQNAINSLVPGLSDSAYQLWERYYRCRLLQDYISGMTDQFAFDEYKSLMVTN